MGRELTIVLGIFFPLAKLIARDLSITKLILAALAATSILHPSCVKNSVIVQKILLNVLMCKRYMKTV